MGNNTHEVPTLTWVAGHKVGSPLVVVSLREVNHLVLDANRLFGISSALLSSGVMGSLANWAT